MEAGVDDVILSRPQVFGSEMEGEKAQSAGKMMRPRRPENDASSSNLFCAERRVSSESDVSAMALTEGECSHIG